MAEHPDSIGAELVRRTARPNDYDTLSAIVDERARKAPHQFCDGPAGNGGPEAGPGADYRRKEGTARVRRYPNSTAVVHLRLGDTIDGEQVERFDAVWTNGIPPYVVPGPFYEELSRRVLPKLGVRRVVLVASAHHGHPRNVTAATRAHVMSKRYRQRVRAAFTDRPRTRSDVAAPSEVSVSVTDRFDAAPDEDFMLMASARCARFLVLGGGGFSAVAGEVLRRRGGVRIWDGGPRGVVVDGVAWELTPHVDGG